MNLVSLVIKFTNNLISIRLEKNNLDKLITNINFYKKDIQFISDFISEYFISQNPECLPTSNGIIFIDLVNDIILDSQKVTGINKITPAELKQKADFAVVNRFKELVDAGYLKGFEVWQDNGHHLNTSVTSLKVDDLIKFAMETPSYGQFVFSTHPFKVEYYELHDWIEQTELFGRLITLGLLPAGENTVWKQYIEGVK